MKPFYSFQGRKRSFFFARKNSSSNALSRRPAHFLLKEKISCLDWFNISLYAITRLISPTQRYYRFSESPCRSSKKKKDSKIPRTQILGTHINSGFTRQNDEIPGYTYEFGRTRVRKIFNWNFDDAKRWKRKRTKRGRRKEKKRNREGLVAGRVERREKEREGQAGGGGGTGFSEIPNLN